jgi:hypothetical protein
MSRARPICGKWFDTDQNHRKATDEQLELLATVEQIELDDLLDTPLTQGEVVRRLREALGQNPIPKEVVERRQKWRRERSAQPSCRKCGKVGDSTKHHFVNKWILKELSNYQQIGSRDRCTIPLCIDCHRDIHARNGEDVSIASLLNTEEKSYAQARIEQLLLEHPKIFNLLIQGNANVYEARLAKDWANGLFRVSG